MGRSFGRALSVMLLVCACAQPQTRAPEANTSATGDVIAGAGVDGHFNPTEAAGGGANAGIAVSPEDLAHIFAAIPNASELVLTASSSPPGATQADVMSISVVGTATGGLFKRLDESAKRALGDGLLTAAAANWPSASISLLLTEQTGAGGQIIGSRAKDGPNTLIVS